MSRVLLLLAGTREARAFAAGFQREDVGLVASLAGVTRDPAEYACETRFGGFGGAEAMARWIRERNVVAVIDASHPFAERISANAAAAAAVAGVRRLSLRRRAWDIGSDGREVGSLAAAAAALPAGARVFLTTGRGDAQVFSGRSDVSFVLRSIEPVEGLPPHIGTVTGRPPFTPESERAFMRERGITHLVTKNSGGVRPAKLEAAEALGIPVFSVAMPPAPPGEAVETVAAALAWAARI